MKIKIKEKAIKLRKEGYSINELANFLSVSKSSISLWVRGVHLDKIAQNRLKQRSIKGMREAIKTRNENRKKDYDKIKEKVNGYLKDIERNRVLDRIFCALLFWCEGEKRLSSVRFINSDPEMVRFFLSLLRSGFNIDESKFRICLHLHGYHDVSKQKKFWSVLTKVPVDQFLKIYNKPNTGKRKREDYQGCVSIRYLDSDLAKELYLIYNSFTKVNGRVG